MSTKNKVISILGLIGFLMVAVLFWYNYQYSMRKAKTFEVNDPNSPTKLLIATQGSKFKEAIVLDIVDYFKSKNVYIKVIDVNNLGAVNVNLWDGICLIHTWEMWDPPKAVEVFINQYKDNQKLIILTTSGNNRGKIEGVDAITGASIMEDAPKKAEVLIELIEVTLQ